jgi:hypothetical protein
LKQVFEEFLQRLLQKPTLRGSDLLHSFLRSSGDFVPAGPGGIAGAMPEGLGRMIRRSVPLRLCKERGQHLDTFLNAFIASTEGSKTKPRLYAYIMKHNCNVIIQPLTWVCVCVLRGPLTIEIISQYGPYDGACVSYFKFKYCHITPDLDEGC